MHGDGGQAGHGQSPRRAGRPWCSRPPWPRPPSRPGRRPAPPGRGAPAVAGSPAASRRRPTRLRPRCVPPGAVRRPTTGRPRPRRSAARPKGRGHRRRAAVPARGNGRRPVSRRLDGGGHVARPDRRPPAHVAPCVPTPPPARAASSPLGAATGRGRGRISTRPSRMRTMRSPASATPGRGSRAGSPGRRRATAEQLQRLLAALGVERTRPARRPAPRSARWRAPGRWPGAGAGRDRTPEASRALSARPSRSSRSQYRSRPGALDPGDDRRRRRHVLQHGHALEQVEELEDDADVDVASGPARSRPCPPATRPPRRSRRRSVCRAQRPG